METDVNNDGDRSRFSAQNFIDRQVLACWHFLNVNFSFFGQLSIVQFESIINSLSLDPPPLSIKKKISTESAIYFKKTTCDSAFSTGIPPLGGE